MEFVTIFFQMNMLITSTQLQKDFLCISLLRSKPTHSLKVSWAWWLPPIVPVGGGNKRVRVWSGRVVNLGNFCLYGLVCVASELALSIIFELKVKGNSMGSVT